MERDERETNETRGVDISERNQRKVMDFQTHIEFRKKSKVKGDGLRSDSGIYT